MDDDVLRVSLGRVLPGCEGIEPPIQPAEEDEGRKTLAQCHGWALKWPKTQIRLGGRDTGATSIVRRPTPTEKGKDVVATDKLILAKPVVATDKPLEAPPVVATDKSQEAPPVVATDKSREAPPQGAPPAATSQKAPSVDDAAPRKIVRPPPRRMPPVAASRRHQQLLGVAAPAQGDHHAAAPQRPPLPSSPPPHHDTDMAAGDAHKDNSDDDNYDTDAFLNTGADMEGLYMPAVDEEFQARDAYKAGGSKPTKQRLVFTGLSQETPPADDPQDKRAGIIFSPNTIKVTTGEQLASAPAMEEPLIRPLPKKPRKRTRGNAGKAASQPAPQLRFNDRLVPPMTDGYTRMHEAGKPILPPELERIAEGQMMHLQDSIQFAEELLLKDKDPNYPVFTVRVPKNVGFVTDPPAELFFIAYEDVFKLFHAQRLDYNMVRLFALNLAMSITRENTPDVAVADPYFMRDSQLREGNITRVKAKLYLQKFFLENRTKGTVLLPFFPE